MGTTTFTSSSNNADSPQPAPRKQPLFPLGQIVATPGVLDHLTRHSINVLPFIDRHVRGDWGNVDPEDAQENDFSVQNGFRVLSAYDIAGERVWIITEADRSVSTLLFSSEY